MSVSSLSHGSDNRNSCARREKGSSGAIHSTSVFLLERSWDPSLLLVKHLEQNFCLEEEEGEGGEEGKEEEEEEEEEGEKRRMRRKGRKRSKRKKKKEGREGGREGGRGYMYTYSGFTSLYSRS